MTTPPPAATDEPALEALLARLEQAGDLDFADWVQDTRLPALGEVDVAAIKALAEAQHDPRLGHRILDRTAALPAVQADPRSLALVWRGRANIHQAQENFDASITAAATAAAIYRARGEHFDEAVASVIQVVAFGLDGDYAAALAVARRIRPLIRNDPRVPLVLGHLALARAVAHTVVLRRRAALADYARALHHFNQIPGSESQVALAYLNMGVLANQLDRLDEARSWLLSALATFEHDADPANLVKCHSALAYNCVRRTDYQSALTYLAQARRVLEPYPDWPDNGFIDFETAAVLLNLNQFAEAERRARQAVARFVSLERRLDTAEALLVLARVLARTGAPGKLADASASLEQAEQRLAGQDLPVFVAWVQLDQAELLLRRNLPEQAAAKARAALPTFVRERLVLLHAQTHLVLGDACWRWEAETARNHYWIALRLNRQRDPLITARARRGLGRLASIAGRWRRAEAHFAVALQALETVRRTLHSHLHQASLLEDKRPLAMELFAALTTPLAAELPGRTHTRRVGLATRLVGWLERWKAAALADLLANQPPDLTLDAATQTLLTGRDEILRRLDSLQQAGLQAAGGPGLSVQRAQALPAADAQRGQDLASLRRQLQVLDDQLAARQAPPLAWRQAAPLESSRLHGLLDADSLLVSYYSAATPTTFRDQGVERLYALTVGPEPGDLAVHELPATAGEVMAAWEKASSYLYASLLGAHQSGRPAVDEPGARQRLGRLYAMLIAPLASRCAGKRRLIVLPEGDLAHIPFAALYDAGAGRYLVEQFAVQTAPSATVLATCGSRPLATAPPVLVGYPGRRGSPSYLTHVAKELHAIAGYLPNATVLRGSRATLDNLWPVVPGCALLHLAAHAHFNSDFPLEANVELAGGRNLRAADLYLRYDLLAGAQVVLSGCSTGQVRSWGGDMLGLISSLLYAGASAVIAGLWPVDDRATAALMAAFYARLSAGDDGATALQAAQCELLRSHRFSSPYLWAPFTLCGDARGLRGRATETKTHIKKPHPHLGFRVRMGPTRGASET